MNSIKLALNRDQVRRLGPCVLGFRIWLVLLSLRVQSGGCLRFGFFLVGVGRRLVSHYYNVALQIRIRLFRLHQADLGVDCALVLIRLLLCNPFRKNKWALLL